MTFADRQVGMSRTNATVSGCDPRFPREYAVAYDDGAVEARVPADRVVAVGDEHLDDAAHLAFAPLCLGEVDVAHSIPDAGKAPLAGGPKPGDNAALAMPPSAGHLVALLRESTCDAGRGASAGKAHACALEEAATALVAAVVADDRHRRVPHSRNEAARKADLRHAVHALLDEPNAALADDKLKNALKHAAKDVLARKDARAATSNWSSRTGLRRSLSRIDSS